MLYEMDTKMFVINNTLQHLMWNIDVLHYESMYYITSKQESIEYILLYMLYGEILNLCLSI